MSTSPEQAFPLIFPKRTPSLTKKACVPARSTPRFHAPHRSSFHVTILDHPLLLCHLTLLGQSLHLISPFVSFQGLLFHIPSGILPGTSISLQASPFLITYIRVPLTAAAPFSPFAFCLIYQPITQGHFSLPLPVSLPKKLCVRKTVPLSHTHLRVPESVL